MNISANRDSWIAKWLECTVDGLDVTSRCVSVDTKTQTVQLIAKDHQGKTIIHPKLRTALVIEQKGKVILSIRKDAPVDIQEAWVKLEHAQ